jgi:hypothetical protein
MTIPPSPRRYERRSKSLRRCSWTKRSWNPQVRGPGKQNGIFFDAGKVCIYCRVFCPQSRLTLFLCILVVVGCHPFVPSGLGKKKAPRGVAEDAGQSKGLAPTHDAAAARRQ